MWRTILAIVLLLPGIAYAQERPEWAFGPDSSGIAYPRKPDDGVLKQVPGSTKGYTQAQIDDPMHPPDWFPNEHPPMPRVVAEGNGTTVRACIGCHLANGHGHPENSRLPGSSAPYLKRQLEEFRIGKRQGPASLLMNASAKHLTDDEMTAAVDYFSKLDVVPWTRVVETDIIPKTWWRGNRRLQLAEGGTQPIGHEIVEVPQDPARTALRDPHSGTISYARCGSLTRGKRWSRRAGMTKRLSVPAVMGQSCGGLRICRILLDSIRLSSRASCSRSKRGSGRRDGCTHAPSGRETHRRRHHCHCGLCRISRWSTGSGSSDRQS